MATKIENENNIVEVVENQEEVVEIQENGGKQLDKDDIVRLVIQTVKEELAKDSKKNGKNGNDGNKTDDTEHVDGKNKTKSIDNENQCKIKLQELQVAYNTLQIECTWYKTEYERLKNRQNSPNINNNANTRKMPMDKRKPQTDTSQTQATKNDEKNLSVIVHGIPEKEDESIEKTVSDMLKEADCDFGWTVVTKAFRLGKKQKKRTALQKNADDNELTENSQQNEETKDTQAQISEKIQTRPRSIKIQLEKESQKKELFQKKKMLQAKKDYNKVTIRPMRTEAEMMSEKTVRQMYTLALETKNEEIKTIRMKGCNIEINGKIYTPNEFEKIDIKDISPEKAATREHTWGVSFQGHNSPLSNLYKCNVTGKDGKKYTSAEQYYCSIMAKYHEKHDIMRMIDNTENPYTIKNMAKKIWRSPEWCKTNEGVLQDIVHAKFSQNVELKQKLINSPGNAFRECTKCPYWGSGRFLDSAGEGETIKQGYKNKMGDILLKVKESLVNADK